MAAHHHGMLHIFMRPRTAVVFRESVDDTLFSVSGSEDLER